MAWLIYRFCFLTLALTLAMAGCKPVNALYKQDTGEIAAVPGPPPATIAPAPAASDSEVTFIDPGAEDALLESEIDAIEPLPEPEPIVETKTYTIQKGDNYWKIAKEIYGDPMKMKDIEAANPGIDPKKLKIGDEIILP